MRRCVPSCVPVRDMGVWWMVDEAGWDLAWGQVSIERCAREVSVVLVTEVRDEWFRRM